MSDMNPQGSPKKQRMRKKKKKYSGEDFLDDISSPGSGVGGALAGIRKNRKKSHSDYY